jgi:signal transduction histidine kinase
MLRLTFRLVNTSRLKPTAAVRSAMQQQTDDRRAEQFKVLLVEDSAADAEMVLLALRETRGAMAVRRGLFTTTRVDRLRPALRLLGRKNFDVVLLDLGLPDSDGLETLAKVRAAAPDLPVVVLAGLDDDGLALTAIQRGAQDYLAKDRLDGCLLRRTLRHAIERQRAEVQLLQHARQIEAANARIERQAAQLKARAEQLDRVNRELDDFTYIASHDLKEPLRGIRAYCEILLEDYHEVFDVPGQRRLAMLVDLCDRLETLIGDLLTYCRVGGTRPADTGIDLGAVVGEVLRTLRPTIDRRGASVRVMGRLPKLTGDATLIGMALANLISNGLKFNDRAQPQLQIGCLPSEPPTFYVRDDGIGIDRKHHEAIFTIFRRLHSRKEYEGTGAGLTIVQKIVQSHGGRIWVESEPGAGSTFFFTLAATDGRPAGKPPTKPPHWGERSLGKKRGSVSFSA